MTSLKGLKCFNTGEKKQDFILKSQLQINYTFQIRFTRLSQGIFFHVLQIHKISNMHSFLLNTKI